jgi:hypothetical protein
LPPLSIAIPCGWFNKALAAGPPSPDDPTGGAPIVGVGLLDKRASIKIYKKQSHYNQWEFVYDPTQNTITADAGNMNGPSGTGANGSTTSGFGNNNGSGTGSNNGFSLGSGSGSGSGFGSSSGSGFGSSNGSGFGGSSGSGFGGSPTSPVSPSAPVNNSPQ